MDEIQNNPSTNHLPGHLTETKLLEAIEKSGYPLQTEVACILQKTFTRIQEEWCFIDRETNDLRPLDLMSQRDLFGNEDVDLRVRPTLTLLIECKKAQLPYVFFKSQTVDPIHAPFGFNYLPIVAGSKSEMMIIHTDDNDETFTLPILAVIELENHPFLHPPTRATAFSRCNGKGKDYELSGDLIYNEIVHPLLKAVHYWRVQSKPAVTHTHFDLYLTIPLAVIDAPLVLVDRSGLTLAPWVRLERHQYDFADDANMWERRRRFVIDFVHNPHFASPGVAVCELSYL